MTLPDAVLARTVQRDLEFRIRHVLLRHRRDGGDVLPVLPEKQRRSIVLRSLGPCTEDDQERRSQQQSRHGPPVLSEGLRPSDSPARPLARRCAGALPPPPRLRRDLAEALRAKAGRSRGSL